MTTINASRESFACPHCRIELRLRPGAAMVSGPCPSCGGMIEAPVPVHEFPLDARTGRVKLPPRREAGVPPLRRSDEAPAPPAERVRLSRDVAAMPAGNNFGSERPGAAASRRREESRRAIWKNLLSLTLSTLVILVSGAAALKTFEKKAQTAPEPAAVSPDSGTSSIPSSSPDGGEGSMVSRQRVFVRELSQNHKPAENFSNVAAPMAAR